MQQPDSRDQPDCEGKVHPCKAEAKDSNKDEETDSKQGTNADLVRHYNAQKQVCCCQTATVLYQMALVTIASTFQCATSQVLFKDKAIPKCIAMNMNLQ